MPAKRLGEIIRRVRTRIIVEQKPEVTSIAEVPHVIVFRRAVFLVLATYERLTVDVANKGNKVLMVEDLSDSIRLVELIQQVLEAEQFLVFSG